MENRPNELKSTSYELFIGALSVLSIFNLILYYFLPEESISTVIIIIDVLLSLIFLSDFLFRFFTTDSKSGYFFRRMGWADLLASLPLPQFKILRMFRILRVYRLGKEYGGARMIREFFANRGGSALLVLLFLMILILEFGGLGMLWIESQSPNANITTASDAVWYVYVTITTVGYGDQYPVTNAGRVLGTLIMTIGVGLFGTITAFLANIFIVPDDDGEAAPDSSETDDVIDLSAQMKELKSMLQAYEQDNRNLQAKIKGLESVIENLNV